MRELIARGPDADCILENTDFAALDLTAKKWYKKNKNQLIINESGILCLKGKELGDPVKIVLPDFFKNEIMFETHELMDHAGITKTAEKVERHFVWPGLRCDVQRHVTSCVA